eukprot:gene7452-181_t
MEERLELGRRVVQQAAGRVPVVAGGTFGGTIADQAAFVNRYLALPCYHSAGYHALATQPYPAAAAGSSPGLLVCLLATAAITAMCFSMAAETKVDAVVVMTCHLALENEGPDIWLANAELLVSLTGDVPLGLYECPVPYKRLVTPEQLSWAAGTGRFLFHKDTCCNTSQIKVKLQPVLLDCLCDHPAYARISTYPRGGGGALAKLSSSSPFRFYNANVETLSASNEAGGAGFSGISANFYPWLHARLCNKDCSAEDVQSIQRFLSVAEAVVCDGYPRSAKAYLAQYGTLAIREDTRVESCRDIQFNEAPEVSPSAPMHPYAPVHPC